MQVTIPLPVILVGKYIRPAQVPIILVTISIRKYKKALTLNNRLGLGAKVCTQLMLWSGIKWVNQKVEIQPFQPTKIKRLWLKICIHISFTFWGHLIIDMNCIPWIKIIQRMSYYQYTRKIFEQLTLQLPCSTMLQQIIGYKY